MMKSGKNINLCPFSVNDMNDYSVDQVVSSIDNVSDSPMEFF